MIKLRRYIEAEGSTREVRVFHGDEFETTRLNPDRIVEYHAAPAPDGTEGSRVYLADGREILVDTPPDVMDNLLRMHANMLTINRLEAEKRYGR